MSNGQENAEKLVKQSLLRVRRKRRLWMNSPGEYPKGKPQPLLVVEGDSWINYKSYGIGAQLENQGYDIESVADHGDRLKDMAGNADQHDSLTTLLLEFDRKDWRPEAFVVSAGGNDLAEKCKLRSLLNESSLSANILNDKEVKKFMDGEVKYAYLTLLKFISQMYRQIFKEDPIPIVIHGYGNPVPDDRPVTFGPFRATEPWLKPEFEKKGYTCLQQNTSTMKCLVEKFNNTLVELCQKPAFDHVHYVDVRDCLSNDLQNDKYKEYWENELHPTRKGFECVTSKIDQRLKDVIEV